MRRLAALGAVLLLLVIALVLRSREAPTEEASELAGLRERAGLAACPTGLGEAFPKATLPCLGGGPDVPLRGMPAGVPVLVNVWGTWCPPCVREVDELVAFSKRAGDRVALVGVLTQDTAANGLRFSAEFGVRWPSVIDDDGLVLRAFRPGPPVTLLLDASGRVVHRKSGEFRDVAEIEALVAKHLGVRV
ncbi:MAG TPA: TlpA disulfide reductase family protein [Mycobacteriales bacterium]|nr:TlpA disulfide reductase family protein [Mycobacteriales bacterium]